MTELPSTVKFDPLLGISGLFRPLQAQREPRCCLVRKSVKGTEWEWATERAPGIPEQTLLLVIMGLAGVSKCRLATQPESAVGCALRGGLEAEGEAFTGETVSLRTSRYELAHLCGYADAGGSTLRRIDSMLHSLSRITVKQSQLGSMRLFSAVYAEHGSLRLALSTRLAQAARGERYATISLIERSALPTHTAKALHCYLSCMLSPSRSWRFRWESLERAVWGLTSTGSTQRGRCKKLREALVGLIEQGWGVEDAGQVVTVTRPSRNACPA